MLNKGVILKILTRYEEALEALNNAIELMPYDSKAWYNKGAVLVKLGCFEEALAAYDKAIELKEDFPEAWYNLACLYSVKKEKEKALKCLKTAIENGFDDLTLIEQDKELDYIRKDDVFWRLWEF